jgi:hypothetical protein
MRKALLAGLLAALPLGVAAPLPVQAQDAAAAEAQAVLSKEQLDQLLAPIALYPDGLLSQVLMASTYPLEVVEAARWVKANPDAKGDAAVKAVEGKGWDVSVQSLVAFPQVITMMSDKLEWTQDLGNAVLAQQKDVLDSVQRLRAMAQKAGTLQSNEQQKVTVQPAAAGTTTQTIIIEPAQPQTIYVPAYNPTVVYGTWPYPAYTPFYYPPNPYYYPGGALVRGFAWGVGFAAAGAIFGGCNWGRGDIDIDINRATNINRNFNATNINANRWEHNSTHRKGVSYKDAGSRQKYGRNTAGAGSREQFRGRDLERELGERGGDRAGDRGGDRSQLGDRGGDRGQTGDRAGDRDGDRGGDRGGDRAGDRGGDRSGDRGGDRAQAQDRSSQGRDRGGQDFGSRDAGSRGQASARAQPAAFDGMGSRGSDVRSQSSRGQASRQASHSNFGGGGGGGARTSGGGGGARMGGGGGRGGGGRR